MPCRVPMVALYHPIVIEILYQVPHLHRVGKSVVFCWIHGITGLLGNKAINMTAVSAVLHRFLASVELLALMLAASSITVFYPCGKRNGPVLRATNYTRLSCPCKYGISPSVPSVRRSHVYTPLDQSHA